MPTSDFDNLPDVRDGLSRKERIVLYCIDQIQKECGGRDVPTMLLYGRLLCVGMIRAQQALLATTSSEYDYSRRLLDVSVA